MKNYRWVGNLYPDWFRRPASPLERTWRWPLALKAAQRFVKQRLGITIPDNYYIPKDGRLYLRTDYYRLLMQWGTLAFLFKFIRRLSKEKQNFESEVLPAYKALLSSWRQESQTFKDMNTAEIWQWMKSIMEVDVAYTVKIVYVGTYGFLFDFLLAQFYKRFVKDEPDGYHALLAGFPNRTFEMNAELFRLSRIDK